MTKEELDRIQIQSLPCIDTEQFIIETNKEIDLYSSLSNEEVKERIEELYSNTNLYIEDIIVAIINYNARILSVYYNLDYEETINTLLNKTLTDISIGEYKKAVLNLLNFIKKSIDI